MQTIVILALNNNFFGPCSENFMSNNFELILERMCKKICILIFHILNFPNILVKTFHYPLNGCRNTVHENCSVFIGSPGVIVAVTAC